jgi:hypothetical protein
MRPFKNFIAAIQQQSEFDSEAGNIVELMYIRRFRDDEGRILASKHAYFRAFHQRKAILQEGSKVDSHDVFWVLPDDCAFAMDGEAFVPTGIEESDPEGAEDEISLNYGLDYMNVVDACRYSERIDKHESDRCVFYKIVCKDGEPL